MPIHPAGEHLAARAAATPDKAAIVLASTGEVRTYADLDAASARLARVFRDRGLRTGDHLAVLVDNDAAFFEVVWAAMRTGLFVTPINWHLAEEEVDYVVGDSGARVLVTDDRFAPLARRVAAKHPGVRVVEVGAELDGILDAVQAHDLLYGCRQIDLGVASFGQFALNQPYFAYPKTKRQLYEKYADGKRIDHAFARDVPIDLQGQALPRVFVHHGQKADFRAVQQPLGHEVVSPDMVLPAGPQADA